MKANIDSAKYNINGYDYDDWLSMADWELYLFINDRVTSSAKVPDDTVP